MIDMKKIDFMVQLPASNTPEVFGALKAAIPLQMICYLTSVKKGLDPD
jgi:glucosamine 6-phosphate synthetase-like amidotransferase/phosphosugar isomerase protein